MASIETYVVETDGVRLSGMIWRRFRKPMPGLVERVLDLNPGLAGYGPIVPAGAAVAIPIDDPTGPAIIPVVKLWD